MREVVFSSERSSLYIETEYPTNIMKPNPNSPRVPNFIPILLSRISFLFFFSFFVAQIFISFPLNTALTLTPIIIILATSGILEIIQFFRRKKLTQQIDRRRITVLRDHNWIEIPWQAVSVGDIIKLTNGEVAPADLVLLCTTNGGQCAIDTHIIDGSNQLKARNPHKDLHFLSQNQIISNITLTMNYSKEVQEPNSISSKVLFNGTIEIENRQIHLGNSQFIERYSALYQVSDVICGVVYTGTDCRTVKCNPEPPIKFSRFELWFNVHNVVSLVFAVFLALLSATLSIFYRKISEKWPFYDDSPIGEYFLNNFKNFFCLFLTFVPIDVYWGSDIIFLIHSLFIQSDEGTVVPSIYSVNQLGQVDSIVMSKSLLVDKGINVLRVYVNGQIYGKTITSCGLAGRLANGYYPPQSPFVAFDDDNLVSDESTYLFFLHLTLCHSAVPFLVNDYVGYISNFPEDEPLLKLASQYGYVFMRRSNEFCATIFDQQARFMVLNYFPPSPQHPRVSLIFADLDGTVKMFIRGDVDSMRGYVEIPSDVEQTFKEEGLRVICCSYKQFTHEEVRQIRMSMQRARTESADYIFNFINNLEMGGKFLSLIAFEEQPHEGALELISYAKRANIQLILASPSRSSSLETTAISLGFIKNMNNISYIEGNSIETVAQCINNIIEENHTKDVLSIDNDSIPFLVKVPSIKDILKNKVILIEKANPIQIGQLLTIIKNVAKKNVLAIGHSVSDSIYMNNASLSVSVNIDTISPSNYSSDIVVQKLDTLRKLIFLHGGLLRERLMFFLKYRNFYNLFIGYLMFFYSFFTAFSATPIFNESQILSTLMFYTMLPVLSRAIFNQKVPLELLKSSPEYYGSNGLKRKNILLSLFISHVMAIGLSFLIFEILNRLANNVRVPYGDSFSYVEISFTTQAFVVATAILTLIPMCNTWTTIHYLCVYGTLVCFFVFSRIETDRESSGQFYNVANALSSHNGFWALFVFYAGIVEYLALVFVLIEKLTLRKKKEKKLAEREELTLDTVINEI